MHNDDPNYWRDLVWHPEFMINAGGDVQRLHVGKTAGCLASRSQGLHPRLRDLFVQPSPEHRGSAHGDADVPRFPFPPLGNKEEVLIASLGFLNDDAIDAHKVSARARVFLPAANWNRFSLAMSGTSEKVETSGGQMGRVRPSVFRNVSTGSPAGRPSTEIIGRVIARAESPAMTRRLIFGRSFPARPCPFRARIRSRNHGKGDRTCSSV